VIVEESEGIVNNFQKSFKKSKMMVMLIIIKIVGEMKKDLVKLCASLNV